MDGELRIVLCDFGCCTDNRISSNGWCDANIIGYVVVYYLQDSPIEYCDWLRSVFHILNFHDFVENLQSHITVNKPLLKELFNKNHCRQLEMEFIYPTWMEIILKKIEFSKITCYNALIMYNYIVNNKYAEEDIHLQIICLYISNCVMENHDLLLKKLLFISNITNRRAIWI